MGNIQSDPKSVQNIVYDWIIENHPSGEFSAIDIQKTMPHEKLQSVRASLFAIEKAEVIEAVAKRKIAGFRSSQTHFKYLGPNHSLKFHKRPERHANYNRNVMKGVKRRKFEDYNQENPKYNYNKKPSVNQFKEKSISPLPFHERLFALAVEAEGLLQAYSDAALLMEVRRRGLKIGD